MIRTPTPSHRNLVANVPGVTGDRACGKIGSAARGVPLSGGHRNLVANVPGVTGDRACGKIGSAVRGVPLSGPCRKIARSDRQQHAPFVTGLSYSKLALISYRLCII